MQSPNIVPCPYCGSKKERLGPCTSCGQGTKPLDPYRKLPYSQPTTSPQQSERERIARVVSELAERQPTGDAEALLAWLQRRTRRVSDETGSSAERLRLFVATGLSLEQSQKLLQWMERRIRAGSGIVPTPLVSDL